jgi:citrate/tricarballylate utilization protein
VRLGSYEEYCWPAFMSGAFKNGGVGVSLCLSVVSMVLLWLLTRSPGAAADFYALIPHDVMVAVFGLVGAFVTAALVIGYRRAAASYVVAGFSQPAGPPEGGHYMQGLRDALSLRHLHSTGVDCTSDVEVRTPWRRYFHHCTFYGFALCFASTSVAAIYHVVFGWRAPYAYASLPVILGTIGGAGLLIGPLGLLAQRRQRDPELKDPAQAGLDSSFIVMLLMTSLTGLLLLALRSQAAMTSLLVIHLGFVLGLFLTLPYGKFVHGIYRTAALLRFSSEAHR